MAKDFFSVANTTHLNKISPPAKIHIIGVAGVAMGQLAIELSERGFTLSGSDKEFYEPMGRMLAKSKVKLCHGFFAANVPDDASLVVIGNVVSYGNEEVDVVEKKKLPYTFFPQILCELLIDGRHSIVVSGTHGKTTTTSMIASILFRVGKDPSYFIGGVSHDLPKSLHMGKGNISVVEGDEYDSAFFAKVPKFSFYKPKTLIVTSVEYDHADIYPSLEAIDKEFNKLVMGVPEDGVAICCIDTPHLKDLFENWKTKAKCRLLSYGEDAKADCVISERKEVSGAQRVSVSGKSSPFSFSLKIPGLHNAKNALAGLLACEFAGVPFKESISALSQYKGVKRRQEARYEDEKVTLVEDFAHHPTAVKETIAALRDRYPGRRLWALFEPRSNTSRKKVFQIDYVKAFTGADRVVLCDVAKKSIDGGEELLDVKVLSDEINSKGITSLALPDAHAIKDHVMKEFKKGDVILVMSNGEFGGLIEMLCKACSAHALQ